METLIIQREEKKITQVKLPSPYYAMTEDWLCKRYWAITEQKNNLTLYLYHNDNMPLIGSSDAKLPEDHTQITEEEFREAFDQAIGQLQAKACAACPNYL